MKLNSIKNRFSLFLALIIFLFSGMTFAEETSIENLHKFKLKNGLELFVAENHTVPLVYIEICVRGGGIAQTKENAGLFHLYEHLMFKGNKKYKTAEAMQDALSQMGVASWNGSTNVEYVNYYFTIPTEKLKDGLEFWSYAIRKPIIDKREFEAEKKVVLSEIEGDAADPGHQINEFISEKMFYEAPWIRSPGGSAEVVANSTVKDLRKIQKEYYIPNNASLYVGGDVNPEEVYKLVKKIYGSWRKGKNPWENNVKEYSKSPLEKTEYYVVPFDKVSPQMAQIMVDWRGPDAEFDRVDTYTADMLLHLANNPQSYFIQSMLNNPQLGIPDENYLGLGYATSRRVGIFNVTALMLYPEQYLPLRTKMFVENIQSALKGTVEVSAEEEDLSLVKKRLYNSNVFDRETASGLLSTARFWWACTDADYYFSYSDNVSKVGNSNLEKFIDKYVSGKNALVIVLVNPDVYEQFKADFAENGFVEFSK
ncbi:MAG: insulinase family protein [Treponema sp.]|nr:insulinase family protein [Treponema sp.]